MTSYNTDKPVIILGSGPTARKIPKSDEYYICTVMLGSFLCEETDFWVLNDAHVLHDFSDSKLKTSKNLAIPEYPHSVVKGSSWPTEDIPSKKVVTHLTKYMDIHNFNIQTVKRFNINYNKNLPFFETTSSGESAIKWLHYKGFKKIITLGLDKEGGRHSNIPGRLATGFNRPDKLTQECGPPERYNKCHNRVVDFTNNTPNFKVIRLISPEVNDEIIKSLKWDFENHIEIKVSYNESR